MICIKTDIPQEICDIDDEQKAIHHSKDTVCIWVYKTREDRNMMGIKISPTTRFKAQAAKGIAYF